MSADLIKFLPEDHQFHVWNNHTEPKSYLEKYKEYLSRPFHVPREIHSRKQELIDQGKLRY